MADGGLPYGLRVPDEGLFGPGSASWEVHADPSLLLGGLRALLLQALHPLAMAGVAQHSAFREDPWGRLYRTAFFIGAVTYGTGEEVREAVGRVRRVHEHVRGTDPATGRPYRADDPDLLVWVHATEVGSFLDVARRAGLAVSGARADAYLREQVAVARLVGVPPDVPVPDSRRALDAYVTRTRPELQVTPAAREAVRLAFVPPLHGRAVLAAPALPAWGGLMGLAMALLPPWARRMYGLPGWRLTDRTATLEARALRAALLRVPRSWWEGPHLVEARRRYGPAAPDLTPARTAGPGTRADSPADAPPAAPR
ncbi:oxygenase MpaB family protein [Kitasatospora sp. NPDC059571]|uniref:oxygenase MpaB family protein n=1 Tax=Kitasatospora sp. NPDC059571 TaxID=3346871 RepID=UPI003691FACD